MAVLEVKELTKKYGEGETSDSFFLLMIDTLFLYVLVHAKGWGAANHLAVREKILSEEE